MLLVGKRNFKRSSNGDAHDPSAAWMVGRRIEPKKVRPAPGEEPYAIKQINGLAYVTSPLPGFSPPRADDRRGSIPRLSRRGRNGTHFARLASSW